MAPKALEFLVVDGEYSKKRIGAAIAGLSAFVIFIWLIVLSAKLGALKEHGMQQLIKFRLNCCLFLFLH